MKPFSYHLLPDRIAQRPVRPYDAAKLLVANRNSGIIQDSVFSDITSFLQSGDLLVFNDSRVIPARVFGVREDTGSQVEILLIKKQSENTWRCMGRPLKKFKEGTVFRFSDELCGSVVERAGDQEVLIRFEADDVSAALHAAGVMPIPPYIRKGKADDADREDYQPHFAEKPGSIAAPTASLHFTPELVTNLKEKGIEMACLTLHVGQASFLPLWSEGEESPVSGPLPERYVVDPGLVERCKKLRREGGRVVAVGTTAMRALESMARYEGEVQEVETDLFISPGFEFQLVDALVTNFHQPRTSHLLLVEAFIGKELLEKVYAHALESDYRFLSYGDGMLLI